MEPTPNSPRIVDVDTRVRNNTGSAALAGGLLVLFGFFFLSWEAGTDLSTRATNVFCLTVRVGGLALIGVAVWSTFGHVPALLADAIISLVIGLAFAVTAVLMLVDVGWWILVQTLIYLICGTMFLNSSLRTWRDYRELVRLEAADEGLSEEDIERLAAPDGSPLASQLLEQRGQRAVRRKRLKRRTGKPELVDFEPVKRAGRGARTTPQDQPIDLDEAPSGAAEGSQEKSPPPSQGYLADFGKTDRSTKP